MMRALQLLLLSSPGLSGTPPTPACQSRVDAWCNVKTNNPSTGEPCGRAQRYVALDTK